MGQTTSKKVDARNVPNSVHLMLGMLARPLLRLDDLASNDDYCISRAICIVFLEIRAGLSSPFVCLL